MFSDKESQFNLMDRLSLQGAPFFFIIDFLMNNIEIYTPQALEEANISIDFRGFKQNLISPESLPEPLLWEAFPESLAAYASGFHQVQWHLKKGNSYLANYTRKTKVSTNLSLPQIFAHTKAKYKLLYPEKWVCFSPETFVEIKKNTIATYPMKGTIEASLPNAEERLKQSTKEKAEHYTVVDLLRNDLSTVADAVEVKKFQHIDFLQTQQKNLYAMSSEIVGQLKPEFQNKIGQMMKKLLPAGSILGAPKPKTLELILEAEGYDRGFYTGVAGWFDGENLDSCVLIRWIEQTEDGLYFKSGGGITHQSQLEEEYQEMKNKIYVPIY
ncbi:aminodeoxychorismate synthase component I [Riemerella columbina]|uniref:aminodeoxychorismate synthase component I n=1 Tax=Riemerella columbina TaxID=103810 RepID=UPI00266ED033|nr:aminodeoxychorismate synthase component I [Riemerella columbina]WKS95241.1 aminodeoxychorismate synthase component I [Riemerella columbina]